MPLNQKHLQVSPRRPLNPLPQLPPLKMGPLKTEAPNRVPLIVLGPEVRPQGIDHLLMSLTLLH